MVATLVVTALGATVATAQQITYFNEPLAIAEAAAPFSDGVDWDFDVTVDDGYLTPLVAKQARSVSFDAGNSAHAQALANSDGPHGFSAEASALWSRWSTARPHARAYSAMELTVEPTPNEERVKAVLEFSVALTAGLEANHEASSAMFWIEVGEWWQIGQLARDGAELKLAKLPRLFVPALFGAAGFHQQLEGRDESSLFVYANGFIIEQQQGRNAPVKTTKRIVMNLPAGRDYVVFIGASAQGNAAAYLDPIVFPHPDNPDAKITLRGAHDPTSPTSSFPGADKLIAAGIDVAPLREMGVLDPPEPPCTGGTTLARAKLAIENVATADSRLRLRGELALRPLPLDPSFDPIARGLRVRVEDVDGQVILDDVVPGGAFDPATRIGWRHQPAHDRWVYLHPGRPGIHRLVVKQRAGADQTYRVTANAYLPESTVPTADRLPLTATIVVDAPVAREGQCGAAIFDEASPGAECPVLDDTRLVCRRGGAGGGG